MAIQFSEGPLWNTTAGKQSKGHERHPIYFLEAYITVCVQTGVTEKKIPGRSLTPGQNEPRRSTNECLNIGVHYTIKKG